MKVGARVRYVGPGIQKEDVTHGDCGTVTATNEKFLRAGTPVFWWRKVELDKDGHIVSFLHGEIEEITVLDRLAEL